MKFSTLIMLAGRHRGVAIGLFAQVLQYGAALLLLPFIVTRLSAAEVGIWFVFATIQGLAALADFGFQPTIARNVAAAFAGARHLQREGLSEDLDGAPNLALAASVLAIARRLYFWIAGALLVLLLTGGTAYVSSLARGVIPDMAAVLLAWVVFSVATAANFYFLWVSPLMLGSGRPTENYLYVIANRGSFAVIGIVALLSGGGLIALALAALAGVVIARVVAIPFVRTATAGFPSAAASRAELSAILRIVLPNAARMGLVALSAFLVVRFNVLVLSSFEGLAISGSYAVTLQLLTALTAAAQLPSQVALPQIVAARIRGDRAGLRSIVIKRHAFLLATMTAGLLALIFVAPAALTLIGSNIQILPRNQLILLGLVLLLEANHGNCAFIITTANRVPFVRAAILTAIAMIVFSTFAGWSGGGVVGVIVAQGLVQALYSNWKWPLLLWKDLRN